MTEENKVRYTLNDQQKKRLEHWHYHGNVDDTNRFKMINDKSKELAAMIMELTPESMQQSKALTDLEQVRMWANGAIAVAECMERNGSHEKCDG